MINLIVTLSKYLLLILIALYTLESFIVFGYRYEEDKRYILKKQLMLIFFMDFMAFLVIFLKKQDLIQISLQKHMMNFWNMQKL